MRAIRRLTPGDAKVWREIRLAALAGAPGAFSSRHADWARRPLADFAARIAAASVHVATLGDRTVGCAVLAAADDPALRAWRGWVESVDVVPDARGQGQRGRARGLPTRGLRRDGRTATRIGGCLRDGLAPRPVPRSVPLAALTVAAAGARRAAPAPIPGRFGASIFRGPKGNA